MCHFRGQILGCAYTICSLLLLLLLSMQKSSRPNQETKSFATKHPFIPHIHPTQATSFLNPFKIKIKIKTEKNKNQ